MGKRANRDSVNASLCKFFYIFKKDGTVETNKPNVTSASWYYENKFFRIKEDKVVDGNKQSATPYYTITKVTSKKLHLDIKAMKMSYRFKAE